MNPRSQQGQTLTLVLLTLGLTLPALPLFSQLFAEWNKTFGGSGWEEFQSVLLTDDGGYLFGGLTTTTYDTFPYLTDVTEPTRDTAVFPELTGDVWLVKTDAFGNKEWDHRYGGWNQDRMWSMVQAPDGGYLLGGESLSGEDIGTEHTEYNRGGYDYWLVKIDANGNHEWNRTYGGSENDVLKVVIPMDDGGYMLIGHSWSPSFLVEPGDKSENSRGEADYWIVRLYANGNVWWERTLGGDGNDWVNDAEVLPDGNIVIAGWSTSGVSGEKTTPNHGFNDYWVVKIDVNNADIIWQRTYGGDLRDVPLDVFLTTDNDIIICGHSDSDSATGNKTAPHYGLDDGWIIKIKDEGNAATQVWQKAYGGSSSDLAYAAAETSLGNLMIVGVTSSDADTMAGGKLSPLIGGSDFWINYLDPLGNKQWDFSLGGDNQESCVRIVPAHDYGFIFGGHSSSNAYPPYKDDHSRGLNDMYVVRTGCAIDPPNLVADTVTCTNEFITLDATVDSCVFCQYIWSDGITGPVRIIEPDSAVDLRITVVHPDGCEVSDSVSLDIQPGIDTMLADFTPVTCFGDNDAEFIIEEIQGGIGPYLYSLNEGPWDSIGFYTDLEPGFYTLEVIDTNGCTYDTTFYIEQPQEVLLELGDNIYLDYGDSVQLQALTNLLDSFSIQWSLPEMLSCGDCLEPWTQALTTSTNFNVIIKNQYDCTKEDELSIFVENNTAVYIPNAFSPNNDNVNDFFMVYADNSVRQINRLEVFDRYGEKLYELANFQPNIDQLGYDGRHEGKFLTPQVLAYWVEVEYIDGSTELFEGDVQLMR